MLSRYCFIPVIPFVPPDATSASHPYTNSPGADRQLPRKSASGRGATCEACGLVMDRDQNAARNLLALRLEAGTDPGTARVRIRPGPPPGNRRLRVIC